MAERGLKSLNSRSYLGLWIELARDLAVVLLRDVITVNKQGRTLCFEAVTV